MKSIKAVSLFLCLFGLLANAFAEPDQTKSAALLKASQDIPKFFIIDAAKVYRGGRPQPEDLRTLKLAGVKTIIDLQGGDYDLLGSVVGTVEPGELDEVMAQEKLTAANLGMNWVPQRLSSFTMTLTQQATVTRAISIMSDPKMQPVFIHCEFGKDRTGLLAALYEVLFMGISPQTAHQRWVDSGHTGQLDRYATIMLDYYFYKVTSGMSAIISMPN